MSYDRGFVQLVSAMAVPQVYMAAFILLAAAACLLASFEWRRLGAAQRRLAQLRRDIQTMQDRETAGEGQSRTSLSERLCVLLAREAKDNLDDPLSPWLLAADQASRQHENVEPSALTDAIWSKEKERNHWPRFLAKNMILVGLFFTSLGLADAVLNLQLTDTANALKHLNDTLNHMATAFITSILGLFFNFTLTALLIIPYEAKRDAYLKDVDSFLQGIAIPSFQGRCSEARERRQESHFAQFAAKSLELQTAVRDSHARLEGLVSQLVSGLDSQVDTLSKTVAASVHTIGQSVAGIHQAIGDSVEANKETSQAFAENVRLFQLACGSFRDTADRLNDAYESGVDKLTESVEGLQKTNNEALELFETIDDSNKEIVDNIRSTTTSYQSIASRLDTYQESVTRGLSVHIETLERLTTEFEATTSHTNKLMSRLEHDVPASLGAIGTFTSQMLDGFTSWDQGQRGVLSSLETLTSAMQGHEDQLGATLKRVYDEHRSRMGELYQEVGRSLGNSLNEVAKLATESVAEQLPRVSQESIAALQRLQSGFDQLIANHNQAVQQLAKLTQALGFNEASLEEELNKRRSIVDAQLNKQVDRLGQEMRATVELVLTENTKQSYDHVRTVCEAVAKKYEDLMNAQSAAYKAEPAGMGAS